MLGFVSTCNIHTVHVRNNTMGAPVETHQITIMPFEHSFARDVAVWGKVLQFSDVCGTIFSNGMSFGTRVAGTEESPSTCTSVLSFYRPVLLVYLEKKVSSPLKKSTSRLAAVAVKSSRSSKLPSYPQCLFFGDESKILYLFYSVVLFTTMLAVPVYDGRPSEDGTDKGFCFTDDDFNTLINRKRWVRRDVPQDAAVAVGYTIAKYTSSLSGIEYTNVSTNVMFVVVLGLHDSMDDSM